MTSNYLFIIRDVLKLMSVNIKYYQNQPNFLFVNQILIGYNNISQNYWYPSISWNHLGENNPNILFIIADFEHTQCFSIILSIKQEKLNKSNNLASALLWKKKNNFQTMCWISSLLCLLSY